MCQWQRILENDKKSRYSLKAKNSSLAPRNISLQEMLLDCEQSNVLLACIIFFCILLRAFLLLSACIRDPASN